MLSTTFVAEASAQSLPFVDCPAGGEQVQFSRAGMSSRSLAVDPLDSRPIRIWPLEVPECPLNRFPLYRLFTHSEGMILAELVKSEAYREATETMTAWARVVWIEEQLNSVSSMTRVKLLSRDLRGMDEDAVVETYRVILPDLIRAVEADEVWGDTKLEHKADKQVARAKAMGQIAFMLHHLGQKTKAKVWLARAYRTLGPEVLAGDARDVRSNFWRRVNDNIRVTELCLDSPAKYRDEFCSVGGVRQFSNKVVGCLLPHGALPATSPPEACKIFTGFSSDPQQLASEINALRDDWSAFRDLFEIRSWIREPVSCDVRHRLGLNCTSPPPSKRWTAFKNFFPDLTPIRSISLRGYSIQSLASRLAHCLEGLDKRICQKFGDPQQVLENGKAVEGFIAAVDQARVAARRRLLWKDAVCAANRSLSLRCSINYFIGMPDADPSSFPELAFEQATKKGLGTLAKCAVLKAMTGRDDRYRKAKLRNCVAHGSDTFLETALRRDLPNFERAYEKALEELVRARAGTIGRELASVSRLGGNSGKTREAIQDERRRLIAFYPKAELWIIEQKRIQIENKTTLR